VNNVIAGYRIVVGYSFIWNFELNFFEKSFVLYFKANDIRRLKKLQISEVFPQSTKDFSGQIEEGGGKSGFEQRRGGYGE